MPRTENFNRYNDVAKDLMDLIGGGGKPLRLPFETARMAAGKRAWFYAMIKALDVAIKKEDNPAILAGMLKRQAMWWRVSMKIVRVGTEVLVEPKGKEWDSPAELLFINQNQTKEALEMARQVKDGLGIKGEEATTGLPSDRTSEVLGGGLSIADMVSDLAIDKAPQTVRMLEQDEVTGHKKMSNGEVWNRYDVFVGNWK